MIWNHKFPFISTPKSLQEAREDQPPFLDRKSLKDIGDIFGHVFAGIYKPHDSCYALWPISQVPWWQLFNCYNCDRNSRNVFYPTFHESTVGKCHYQCKWGDSLMGEWDNTIWGLACRANEWMNEKNANLRCGGMSCLNFDATLKLVWALGRRSGVETTTKGV